jgi:hypothetical protein
MNEGVVLRALAARARTNRFAMIATALASPDPLPDPSPEGRGAFMLHAIASTCATLHSRSAVRLYPPSSVETMRPCACFSARVTSSRVSQA